MIWAVADRIKSNDYFNEHRAACGSLDAKAIDRTGSVHMWHDRGQLVETMNAAVQLQGQPGVEEFPITQEGMPYFAVVRGQTAQIDLNNDFRHFEGEPLTFRVTGLPRGYVLDSAGRIVSSGTGPQASPGEYAIAIYAATSDNSAQLGVRGSFEVRRPLQTTAAVTEKYGLMLTMAQLANAAYRLGDGSPADPFGQESGAPYNNSPTQGQILSHAWVARNLQLLSQADPVQVPDQGQDGSRFNDGTSDGIVHEQNAAMLLARSADALFVAFRGTNGLGDVEDWAFRENHWDHLAPWVTSVVDYMRDQGLTRLYLTGHSLGGAMVQYAQAAFARAAPELQIEGVTFASPGGSRLLNDAAAARITNFVNTFDPIRLAHPASDLWNQTYVMNNHDSVDTLIRSLNPFDRASLLDGHRMDLYLSIARALSEEGIDITDIRSRKIDPQGWLAEVLGAGDRQLQLHVPLTRNADGSIDVGTGNDIVLAGLLQTALAAAKLVVPVGDNVLSKLMTTAATLQSLAGFVRDPNLSNWADVAMSTGDFLDSAKQLTETQGAWGTWLGRLSGLFDVAGAYNTSDLVTGRGGDDILVGLGGHDVLFGGRGHDVLWGAEGVDALYGGQGNDVLSGHDWTAHALGRLNRNADLLEGGDGDDRYIVDSDRDRTIEFSDTGGQDTVVSYVSWTLGARFEDLQLIDAAVSALTLTGHGNDRDNRMTGGDRANVLYGHGGRDWIGGGPGADSLFGGEGADIFVFDRGSMSLGEVVDGGGARDTLLVQATTDMRQATLRDVEHMVVDGLSADRLTIRLDQDQIGALDGAPPAPLRAITKVGDGATVIAISTNASFFSAAGLSLVGFDPQDLVRISGSVRSNTIVGTSGRDHLIGGGGADNLAGGGGADTLQGESGDDTLGGGVGNDVILGGRGEDTVILARRFDDYTVVAQLDGYLFATTTAGQQEIDRIEEVEHFRFADRTLTVVDLNDLLTA